MNILYVEDNPVDVDLLARTFARMVPSWTVDWANTLLEAKTKLAHPEAYDVILTDMRLPDGNGISLLSFLRERAIPLPVVVLTGLGNEEIVASALKTGATGYVVKRQDYLTKLPTVIESAMNRHQMDTMRSLQRLRVLHIENQINDIRSIKQHFAENVPHIELSVVQSAQEAVDHLRRNTKAYDVLLANYELPDMKGLELLREVREVCRLDIPIVFLANSSDEEIAFHVLRHGFVEYLVKSGDYFRQLPLMLENARNKVQIKREQEALRVSEEYFRSLIENSTDLIYVLDIDGRIQYTSPSVSRVLGYTVADLENRSIFDFMDSKDTTLLRKALENTCLSVGSTNPVFEVRFQSKRGMWQYLEIIGKSMSDPSGHTIFIMNARDSTSKRTAATELQRSYSKLKETLEATIQAMVATVEARDPYTAGHQKRVARLASAIARRMHIENDSVDALEMAGAIHDLGKISIPAEILSTPRKLTPIEMNIIKTHPATGYDILKDIDFPWPIARIVLQHHERLDGSGYPFGLKSEEILTEAKIIAVADVVEAISSHRPYRPALGIQFALQEIERDMGTLYDEDAARTCVRLFSDEGFTFD